MASVDEFNALPDDAARQALRGCCSSARWIDAVAAGRPYSSTESLLGASDEAVAALGEADLSEALAGHPRLGDRRIVDGPAAGHGDGGQGQEAAGWSRQEQAGVSGADIGLRQALADGNVEYEQRFGHIYLACATGRSAAELLTFLRERLGNDRQTEWAAVASELAKINQIRLTKLIGAPSEPKGRLKSAPEARAENIAIVSTHILDTVRGEPAGGVVVRLERVGSGELGSARTDADGRISDFGVATLPAGTYRLVFETGPYLSAVGDGEPDAAPFFPEVVVTFTADGLRPRYHVPLLLSPYSYSTYRGS